jgi:two-component system response regulator YesN
MQCLCKRITGPLPDTKELAQQFFMSESTLKRKFKKRFGLSMSTYFIIKKMAYAQQLMTVAGATLKDTASMVGYKNITNFAAMFKKYLDVHAQNTPDLMLK